MNKRCARPHRRRAELAKIHIGAKELGMDDDTYRGMLRAVAGVDSARDLSADGRRRVLAMMRVRGFEPRSPRQGRTPSVGEDRRLLMGKIEALLADAGRPWDYLTGKGSKGWSMLQRITGKERLEFCSGQDLHKLVAALEYDRKRRAARKVGGAA